MKPTPNLSVERFRVRDGVLASSRHDGNNGQFLIPFRDVRLVVQVSDGLDWDHVSVSTGTRCPTWEEMSHVKDLFFDPEECVVEFHPPRSEYVNHHPYCLHLWRYQLAEFPRPHSILVGPTKQVRE